VVIKNRRQLYEELEQVFGNFPKYGVKNSDRRF